MFETERAALIAGGWQPVGPVFKAPGDTGPTARKWHIVAAYQEEMVTLLPARKAMAAAKRKKAPAKKSGRQTAAKD